MKALKTKKAFTLIELLVVISIIAILLSILMPGLKKAKQVARDTICRSNLKQWGLIWKIYTDENNGKFPDCTGFGGLRGDWIIALRQDYPTGKMTQCPNATKSEGVFGGTFSAYDNKGDICSYGMNNWVYSTSHWAMGSDGDAKIWKTFEDTIGMSNKVPLFMDSAFKGGFPQYDPTYGMYDMITMKQSDEPLPNNGFERVMDGIRQFALPRHGSGSNVGTNVLFMDTSVRPVKVKEMWSLKWHKKFDTTKWQTERNNIWPSGWLDNLSEDF